MRAIKRIDRYVNKSRGFTLLEMLLVIAIIAILAAIVIVAINPGRQLAQARNAQRAADINALDKALKQYYIDNFEWPSEFASAEIGLHEICETGGGAEGCIDISDQLAPKYIPSMPENPSGQNYKIYKKSTNQFGLYATDSTEYSLPPVYIALDDDELAVATEGDGGGGDGCDEECEIVLALREGIIGYWPLDGNAAAEIGSSGTEVGSPLYTDGHVNTQALQTSSSAYVTVSGLSLPAGAAERSVSLWLRVTSGDMIPYGYGSQSSNNPFFIMTSTSWSGKLCIGNWGEGITHTQPYCWQTPLSTGQWIHLVSTYDGSVHRLYANGNSTPVATRTITYSTTNTTLGIGRLYNYSSVTLNGRIEEFAIWDRVLSTGEISQLYNEGAGRSLVTD